MGLKVPAVVAEAKAALDTGHCVVIGLQSTGEVSACVFVPVCVLVWGRDGGTKIVSVWGR